MLSGVVGQAVAVLGLCLVSLGLVYFFTVMLAGIHSLHQQGKSLGDSARSHVYARPPGAGEPVDPAPGTCLYFIVPALNEAGVIAGTVAALADEAPGAQIIVVDDASTDGTADVACAAAPGRVLVVRRELPDARRGKGPALNAGYQALLGEVRGREQNPDLVLVGVMDADGRLSVGAVGLITADFAADPDLGGLQLAVRIRNRQKLLPRMQDFEFWGLSALTQLGRNRFGTVGLGGNGQFSRLSALQSIGDKPWSASLTEDLDLGISLRIAGWSLRTTPDASVDQEGLDKLKGLLRQRTRWLQGHMTCGRRIPEIWASPQLSTHGALELCLNLIVPWAFILLWSLVIHLLYIEFALKLVSLGPYLYGTTFASKLLYGISMYFLSFGPNLVIGFVYHRRDPDVGLLKGLAYGHLAAALNYLYFVAVWKALFRILLGRTGWDKTTRLSQDFPPALRPVADRSLELVGAGVGAAGAAPAYGHSRLVDTQPQRQPDGRPRHRLDGRPRRRAVPSTPRTPAHSAGSLRMAMPRPGTRTASRRRKH
jgi:1,2-diacylglycerol 3-beta-glucosyltransferase